MTVFSFWGLREDARIRPVCVPPNRQCHLYLVILFI